MNSKTHEPTKSVELMTLYWNFFLSPLSSVSFSWSGKMERFHILSRIWECVAFIGNASAKSSHWIFNFRIVVEFGRTVKYTSLNFDTQLYLHTFCHNPMRMRYASCRISANPKCMPFWLKPISYATKKNKWEHMVMHWSVCFGTLNPHSEASMLIYFCYCYKTGECFDNRRTRTNRIICSETRAFLMTTMAVWLMARRRRLASLCDLAECLCRCWIDIVISYE